LPARVQVHRFANDQTIRIISNPIRTPGSYRHNFLGENVLPEGYTRRCVRRFANGDCFQEHIIAPDGTDIGPLNNLIGIDQVVPATSTLTLPDIRTVYGVNEGRLNADGILVNGMPMFSTYSSPTAECTQEAIDRCVDPAEHCPDVEQTSESQGLWMNTSLTPITHLLHLRLPGRRSPRPRLSACWSRRASLSTRRTLTRCSSMSPAPTPKSGQGRFRSRCRAASRRYTRRARRYAAMWWRRKCWFSAAPR